MCGGERFQYRGVITNISYRSSLWRYGVAIAITAFAIVVRVLLNPLLGDDYLYATLFLAVLFSASYHGFGPGVATTFLGGFLTNYFLIPPSGFSFAGPHHIVGQLLYMAVGVGIAFVGGSMRDARREAEAAAKSERRQRERLNSVLDNVVDGIVTIDDRGIIQSFNLSGQRMFGYSASETIGSSVRMLMPESYRADHDRGFANYLRTAEPKLIGGRRGVEGLRKDGSVFKMEVAVTNVQLDGATHFVGVVRDLTERHKLEEQLRQAQKMEAFGQLAGGVAHDFNNLLTVINGNSDLLFNELQPEDDKRDLVDDIRHAGERAAELTYQLLAFSRHQVLAPRVLQLNDVLRQTEKMLRRLIGEDIIFSSVFNPALAPVKVDPGQLEQVVINLAVNARDAMPQGGKLTVETDNIEWLEEDRRPGEDWRPGRYVLLSMTDTGTGMAPEIKARILEPFFTTKGPGQGTGLGLATVSGIIRQSGGHLSVYSEVGVGTSFKIYLPAVEDVVSPPKGEREHSERGTETVLVVEDTEGVRQIARRILERQGYEVLEASSGDAAMRIVKTHPYPIHLLVTDVVMPGMSGRQLVEALRVLRPDLPALFMSGYTDDAVLRHGVIEANEHFVQKPFSVQAMSRKVREVLDENKR